MPPRITISKENYLKAIAEAASEGATVKAVTLARWLHVSAPAVTMAIKRLRRDALIRVAAEGQITLTSSGREIANRLLHRHHLIERMLAEIFGMEWYKVHDEAEQLEHAVSADFERKLIERLGVENDCPHGNRVGMDSPDDRRLRGLKPLEEARPGECLEVVSVFERDRKLLEYLDSLGIRPGVHLDILASDAQIELRAVFPNGGQAAGPNGGQAAAPNRGQAAGRVVLLERAAASKVWAAQASGGG